MDTNCNNTGFFNVVDIAKAQWEVYKNLVVPAADAEQCLVKIKELLRKYPRIDVAEWCDANALETKDLAAHNTTFKIVSNIQTSFDSLYVTITSGYLHENNLDDKKFMQEMLGKHFDALCPSIKKTLP